MKNTVLESCFSESERNLFMKRAYLLLGRQAKKYLAGDSTSVPIDTAKELLNSIFYTLRLALSEIGKSEKDLFSFDLEELLLQGQQILKEKLVYAKRLWEQVCVTATSIPNVYYRETLKGFGVFFRCYDLWYFAHEIPCSIDYPLCVPVSEEIQGVSYVQSWLQKLLTENWLISRFPKEAVIRLLSETAPDYLDNPLNLCEQPLINAVGLALLDRDAGMLEISDDACKKIEERLCGSENMNAELEKAAGLAALKLCASKEATAYIRAVTARACPRLCAVLSSNNLRNFFLP